VVLGAMHFVFLMNIAATLILGQSLEPQSVSSIILAADVPGGLVWGASPDCFSLAVPLERPAIAIICAHIDELRWVSLLLGTPRRPAAGQKAKIPPSFP